MKEWSCFKTIVLTQYVMKQLICTWIQVGASCNIMINECDLIADYDMVVSLGKCWFIINRHNVLIFGTCDWDVRTIVGKHAWY